MKLENVKNIVVGIIIIFILNAISVFGGHHAMITNLLGVGFGLIDSNVMKDLEIKSINALRASSPWDMDGTWKTMLCLNTLLICF